MNLLSSPRFQKNVSVYVGVIGYLAMIIAGEVMIGVWTKLIAELLRISFYKEVKAPDMMGLSMFFICASLVSIATEYFL